MHNNMGNEAQTEVHTFRGRSMGEAVLRLKEVLGPDAVIQGTQRARDRHGSYVEITARPARRTMPPVVPNGPAPTPVGPAVAPNALPQQLASARGPGAYARTARTTDPTLRAAVKTHVAANGLGGPFAERAAWLASQIKERQQAAAITSPIGSAVSSNLPPELAALRNGALPPGTSFDDLADVDTSELTTNYAAVAPMDTMSSENSNGQSVHSAAAPHLPSEPNAPLPPGHVPPPAAVTDDMAQLRREIESLKMVVSNLSGNSASTVSESVMVTSESSQDDNLAQVLGNLDHRMDRLVDLMQTGLNGTPVSVTDALSDRLIQIGVGGLHASDLSDRVRRAIPEGTADDGDVLDMLERFIADDMMCGGEIKAHDGRRRVLAFVGPTGVGKTTTVAKVASEARLAGKRVALVTVDMCRAAAIEQLARYADVLDAPLKVVKKPEDLQDTLDELADYDVVLIDTNGRNPRANDDVDALSDFFAPGWGGELVLTIACSTRESDLYAAVDAFGRLGVERLCITKTDETNDLGVVYSVARRACRPLIWTTNGQRVPDDIQLAQPETWARTIVSEFSSRSSMARAS